MTRENRPKPLPAASTHVVLALLDGELHGYALMRRVEEISDGAVHVKGAPFRRGEANP